MTIERIKELSDATMLLHEKEKRLAADLRQVKSIIAANEGELVELMKANSLTTVGGILSVAELEEKIVPTPVDWAATYAHIQQTGDFDLLHRRLSLTAFVERFKSGVVVPGIEARSFTIVKVNPRG